MKRDVAYVAAGAMLFIVLSTLALASSSVRERLFENSNVNYDYVHLDWIRKAEFLHDLQPVKISFVGTSRTAYAVDPRFFSEESRNLGLFSASAAEMALAVDQLLKKGRQFNEKTKLFIELNPIAFSDFHIEMVSTTESDRILRSAMAEDRASLAILKIPLVRYRQLWGALITSGLNPALNLSKTKRDLRNFERKQVMARNFLGYVGAPKTPGHREEFFSECAEMAAMSLADGELSRGLNYLTQMMEAGKGLDLFFWIPPSPIAFHDERYDRILHGLVHKVRSKGGNVLPLISGLDEDDFFDCMHVNDGGAFKISQQLAGFAVKQ